MLHSRRIILPGKFGKVWYLVPMWKRDQIIRGRIRCPIRISVDFGFYPKLFPHYFSNLIGPIRIGRVSAGATEAYGPVRVCQFNDGTQLPIIGSTYADER